MGDRRSGVGPRPRATGSPACPSETSASGSACRRRRCTPTSRRRRPSTTPCSARAARAFLERLRALDTPRDPERRLLTWARAFAEFCVEDPVRYQLLFQRTIPDFEPSAESYADAIATLEPGRDAAGELGRHHRLGGSLDLWTALLTGIVDQQLSNDPGGQRWTRLLPDAVDMFLAHRRRGRR